jgi:hypothetical protein
MSDYAIYPAIGIARVGDSPTDFYIGPETYRGLPTTLTDTPVQESDLRDANGRMSRQAARFRIFKGTGPEAEEITAQTAGVQSILWTVHLANKKSSWYEFSTNQGENGYASTHPLRNASKTTTAERQALNIDPGPREISSDNRGPVQFDKASVPATYPYANYIDQPLKPTNEVIETLGELRTDDAGRLLVLGGLGISGTTLDKVEITDYANNDGWYDDTSDGPVSATILFSNGADPVEVTPARVLVGPPSYAPEIANLVSLWDTIFDAAVRAGHYSEIFDQEVWNRNYKPNFRTEIGPLLERATLYPWVTAIPPKAHTFDMGMLGTVPPSAEEDQYRGLRTWILDILRAPNQDNVIVGQRGATMMPYLAGDNCLKPGALTSTYLRLTDTQYFFLQQWAEGNFVNDDPAPSAPEDITRCVLENCVGGAFSPGIEMTWISRNPAIYSPTDPFRINNAPPNTQPLGLGFDPAAMEPGDVTRYMAVPWQADFNECSSQPIGERVVWWWPSQRPEFVYLDDDVTPLPEAGIAPPKPTSGTQTAWIGTDFDQTRGDFIMFADDVDMVKYWAGLGFVIDSSAPGEPPRYVEVARALPRPFFPSDDGAKG